MSSVRSSISAAAYKACCTFPRWDGRASRMPRLILKPGEEITVKVLQVDAAKAEDLTRIETAHRRSMVEECRRRMKSGWW